MQLFKCHKIVKAAKVLAAAFADSTAVDLDDGTTFNVTAEMIARYKPVVGDYLVEYEGGYFSFSPKKAFEEGYAVLNEQAGLTFGAALDLLKAGKRVAREGWNGKGMFLAYMPELRLPPFNTQAPGAKVNDRTAKWIGEDQPLNCRPYIAIFNAQKEWQPGWLASQADMFADDWMLVDEAAPAVEQPAIEEAAEE